MTELLQRAIEQVQLLPEDEQDRLAQRMLEAIQTVKGGDEPSGKTAWEIVGAAFKDVPDEEWEKLPKDGAAELDHYVYGTPKRYS
jgi:hypothetical protein